MKELESLVLEPGGLFEEEEEEEEKKEEMVVVVMGGGVSMLMKKEPLSLLFRKSWFSFCLMQFFCRCLNFERLKKSSKMAFKLPW